MIFNKTTPNDWLLDLNRSILNALCKRDTADVSLDNGVEHAGEIIQKTIASKSSIWWVGNGGSASICSHLSQDLLNKLGAKSIFLGDPSLITCMTNDYGYNNVYSRPLEIFVQPGDLLIAISSSGNSENILACADMAIKKGMNLITLSGLSDNNRLWNMKCNLSFFISSNLYGIVEVAHEAILHSIIESMWLNRKDDINE